MSKQNFDLQETQMRTGPNVNNLRQKPKNKHKRTTLIGDVQIRYPLGMIKQD